MHTHTHRRPGECHSCLQVQGLGAQGAQPVPLTLIHHLVKGGLCSIVSVRDRMLVFHVQPLHSSNQTESLAVPRGRPLGQCAVSKVPCSLHFSLCFLLQSSRTREVHQVSIWATPLLASSGMNVHCPAVIPSCQPSFRPILFTYILGGKDGSSWKFSQDTCPDLSRRLLIPPAQPGSPPLPQPSPQHPILVHPSQDPGNDSAPTPSLSGN